MKRTVIDQKIYNCFFCIYGKSEIYLQLLQVLHKHDKMTTD